jgi:hypothetical protein
MADRDGHLDDKWCRPATPMADLERPRGNNANAGAGPLLRSRAASSPGLDQARPLRAARRRPARPGDPADYQKTRYGIAQSSVVICDFGETKPIFVSDYNHSEEPPGLLCGRPLAFPSRRTRAVRLKLRSGKRRRRVHRRKRWWPGRPPRQFSPVFDHSPQQRHRVPSRNSWFSGAPFQHTQTR